MERNLIYYIDLGFHVHFKIGVRVPYKGSEGSEPSAIQVPKQPAKTGPLLGTHFRLQLLSISINHTLTH